MVTATIFSLMVGGLGWWLGVLIFDAIDRRERAERQAKLNAEIAEEIKRRDAELRGEMAMALSARVLGK